jgi:hypothetical protein
MGAYRIPSGPAFSFHLGNNAKTAPTVLRLRNLQRSRRVNWAILPNSVSNQLILKGKKWLIGKSLPNHSGRGPPGILPRSS